MNRVLCRHCSKGKVSRPKGLCWNCYYTPGVRGLYGCADPATAWAAVRGVGNSGYRSGELPPEPTTAPPGTDEKIQVLHQRAVMGVSLFHPDDAAWGE